MTATRELLRPFGLADKGPFLCGLFGPARSSASLLRTHVHLPRDQPMLDYHGPLSVGRRPVSPLGMLLSFTALG
jgi:hypothetical protein